MDLFSHAALQSPSQSPLSERLRPQHLDEIVGQEKVLGSQTQIGRLIRSGSLPSLIFWGPPGTGKTTAALALAQQTKAAFISMNAVDSGAKALREAGEAGRERRLVQQQRTVLFVDEIHRFNRSQQDVLLPYLERGDLILIGATTENPSYELNRALLSRCRVIVFERLNEGDLRQLLERALRILKLNDSELFEPESRAWLLAASDGDGRRLLNSLEILIAAHQPGTPISVDQMKGLIQVSPLAHDKSSEMHYDLISAFIKSVRGSDPDAALYYMTRMLEGGEDPVFIARRLMILASEDIGNADPRALTLAVSALQAVEAIGMPEGGIVLAQATTYLASAPKSNRSYRAYREMQALVRETGSLPVPLALRSARTTMAKDLGYGADYKYPHDHARGWVAQTYLPEELKAREPFYRPVMRGFEKTISDYLRWLRGSAHQGPVQPSDEQDSNPS